MSDSPKILWARCLAIIQNNVNEQQYSTWFAPIKFKSFDAQAKSLVIYIPSQFYYEYLEEHFRVLMHRAIYRIYGEGVKLYYEVEVVKKNPVKQPSEENEITEQTIKPVGANKSPRLSEVYTAPEEWKTYLNTKQNFDNFIEGNSNKLPRSVGKAIAEHPEQQTFNPLFIYGPSGVGKTHLVNAIGTRMRELYPQKRILYLSAHLFYVQYTDSVRRNTFNDFMHFYQSIDVLIMDDIQEFAGLEGTQNTFFHIFNHLHQNGRQIILTCDRPPVNLQGMTDRLLTRFKWGLLAELERPEENLRKNILRNKIEQDGLSIPQDVIDYISANVTDSVRELEGMIHSLLAFSVVYNREVDLNFAQRVLKHSSRIENKPITMDSIIENACSCCNVTADEVYGSSRKANIVEVRQLVMYLAQKHANYNNSKIGTLIGNRNHATVLHGIRAIEKKLKTNKRLQTPLAEIEAKLNIKQ